jgi:hypothetical protein
VIPRQLEQVPRAKHPLDAGKRRQTDFHHWVQRCKRRRYGRHINCADVISFNHLAGHRLTTPHAGR